jgi:hypothetical protein
MSSSADFSKFGATTGYMNVFENNAGAQGGYLWGSGWGVADLKTITSDDLTFELFPNVNNYNAADAYWSDGADDGNKWLEATTYREYTLAAGETEATLDFSVSAFDLDGRYSLTAFVKTLDPNAGYSVSKLDSVDVTGTQGTTTLTINDLTEGNVLQIGFMMSGLNANPDTDWGSATATFESVEVIPEPATLGLLAITGGVLAFLRRFKIV